jgi:hypothetical protein
MQVLPTLYSIGQGIYVGSLFKMGRLMRSDRFMWLRLRSTDLGSSTHTRLKWDAAASLQ